MLNQHEDDTREAAEQPLNPLWMGNHEGKRQTHMKSRDKTRRKKLFLKLILPLLGFLLISSAASYFLSVHSEQSIISSFLLNLGTEFVSIIVTVWIIDEVIRSHERDRWQLVKYLQSKRLSRFVVDAVEKILSMLDLSSVAISSATVTSLNDPIGGINSRIYIDIVDPELLRNEELIFAKLIEHPLDESNLDTIREFIEPVTGFIDQYGPQMGPDSLGLLLQIQDDLLHIDKTLQFDFLVLTTTSELSEEDARILELSVALGMSKDLVKLLRDLMSLYHFLWE